MKVEKLCPWAKPAPVICDTSAYLQRCYQCNIYRELVKQQNSQKREELKKRREQERQMLLWDKHVIASTLRSPVSEWYRQILLLKSVALEKHGFPVEIQYQMFFATGGPGCRKDRPVGEVDGYFICDRRPYTFLRSDFYGIPSDWGIRQYRDSTGIDLKTYIRRQ